MITFLYKIYSFISFLCYPLLIILLKVRIKKGKESKTRWKEKLGFYSTKRQNGKLIWMHCASVGEMNSIIQLASLLSAKANILITTTTLTSAEIFTKNNKNKNISHVFAPLDSIVCVNRFLKHFKPDFACVVESELWLNMIHKTSEICKIVSLNTAISQKSLKSWQKVPNIFRWLLGHFHIIFPSSQELTKSLKDIGIKNVQFVGNLKYDVEYNFSTTEDINFVGAKMICFASIHGGEELELVNAIKKLSSYCLVLIPRHLDKIPQILKTFDENNIKYTLKSGGEKPKSGEVFIVDEMGKSLYFYSISSVVFIGGSLIPIGGHNILEATFFAKPVIIGEFYFKCEEVVKDFLKARAVLTSNSSGLFECINKILTDENFARELGESAKSCTNKYQGVSERLAFNILSTLNL
jgi:3-deoxy-D-manno-octulosonic-acid transferase